MPQTVDRIDFACPDVDTHQWPKLSCGGAGQLALQDGGLLLEANRELLFADNGQIRAFDDNHKLVFDRTNDRLELYEVGDIRFLTGGPTPTEKLRIRADGAVGIGTDTPSALLHVAGDLRIDGTTTVTTDATVNGNLTITGTTTLAGNATAQGNLQVIGVLDAAELRQGGAPLSSSQWDNVGGGINFAGGNVGIGTTSPGAPLHVANYVAVGPFSATSGQGGIDVTGPVAELGFVRRTLTSWPSTRQAGDRFVWYNPNGTARLWTERNGDLLTVTSNGNVGMGTTSPVEKLTISGNLLINDSDSAGKGILLEAADRPMLTRTFDSFSSGKYRGVGRWGLFMEPHVLTLGIPRRSGKAFKFRAFNANSSGSDLLTIQHNGAVGIGTSSPAVKVHVIGNRIRLTKANNANHFIDLRADGSALDLESRGADLFINNHGQTKTRIRNLVNISSREYKEQIVDLPMDEAATLLRELQAVKFQHNDDPTHETHVGFIAEDVPAILATPDQRAYKPTDILAVLTKVVQQQQVQIQQLLDLLDGYDNQELGTTQA